MIPTTESTYQQTESIQKTKFTDGIYSRINKFKNPLKMPSALQNPDREVKNGENFLLFFFIQITLVKYLLLVSELKKNSFLI